jgi:hypothetical protein
MSVPSPAFSDSSEEEKVSLLSEQQSGLGVSSSRLGSPSATQGAEALNVDPAAVDIDDSATCLWDNCGKVYTHLPTLIEHIHNGEFVFLKHKMAAYLSWMP